MVERAIASTFAVATSSPVITQNADTKSACVFASLAVTLQSYFHHLFSYVYATTHHHKEPSVC